MLNFLTRRYFALQNLKNMCTKEQQNPFAQLQYLNLVLRDIDGIKKGEQNLQLTNQKYFHVIPNYYEFAKKSDVTMELQQYNAENIKQLMNTSAIKILKQDGLPLDNLIHTILAISRHLQFQEFVNLLEPKFAQLKDQQITFEMANVISIITFVRFCKSMNYGLLKTQNAALKLYYQSLAFKILLQKKNIQLKQIYSLLHYLQLVKYNQLIQFNEFKIEAEQASRFIMEKFRNLKEQEPDIRKNPEFYAQLSTFLIKTCAFKSSYATMIENEFYHQTQFENNRVRFGYFSLMFVKLQKVQAGERIFDEFKSLQFKGLNNDIRYVPNLLLSLIFFQIRILYEQFIKNPTRENYDQLLKSKLKVKPNIELLIAQIGDEGIEQFIKFGPDLKHQLQQIQSFLNIFGIQSFNIIQEQQEKEQEEDRKNEINIDLESFLKREKITYIKEYREGPYVYDYMIPDLNLVIECDGTYHYLPDEQYKKYSPTLARDFHILYKHKLISINWFNQKQARTTKNPLSYIEKLWNKINNNSDIIFCE